MSEVSSKCPWPDLPWRSRNGKTLGVCDDSMLRQCDVAWPSITGELTSGAPEVIMAWSVVNTGFTQLQPIALKFSIVPKDGLDREEFGRVVGFSKITHENTNFVPQGEASGALTPASLFEPYCNRALRVTEMGMIQAGANAPSVTMNLLADTYAGTARCVAIIFGRAIRGGMTGYQPVE